MPLLPACQPVQRQCLVNMPLLLVSVLLWALPWQLPAQVLPPHPLEPLSADELREAVQLLRSEPLSADLPLISLSLKEPPKVEVLSRVAGQKSRREARALLLDPRTGQVREEILSLSPLKSIHRQPLTDGRAPLLPDEQDRAAQLLLADPSWREKLTQRGLSQPEQVLLRGWPVSGAAGARPVMMLPFLPGTGLPSMTPVEGLSALVDLNPPQVLTIRDEGPLPLPAEPVASAAQPGLRPLYMVQPRGVNFQLEGHALTWDRWRLRYSFQPREGLVLHQVEWQDGTQWRPVLYRASLAELLTLTGEPRGAAWSGRSVLEGSERGLGRYSLPLEAGLDIPDNGVLRAEPLVNAAGDVLMLPARVGIHERDAGVLWRQSEPHSGRPQGRRGLELVLTSLYQLSGAELLVAWSLRQDGSLGLELTRLGSPPVRLQLPGASEPTSGKASTSQALTPMLQAPHGQLFVSVRLDLDVDGVQNAVLESNLKSLPLGRSNPEGTALLCEELPLLTETQAQRDLNLPTQRRWRVVNPSRRAAAGGFVGYTLLNQENAFPLAHEKSPPRKRALFPTHHLWVTRYREGELAATGELASWAGNDTGLARWIDDNDSVDNQDVVLWYTLGLTRVARPEDHPFYGPETVQLRLVPAGFLSQNGALTLPDRD